MYKVVSLFSGCGGLDLGFKKAGFDLLFATDNDPAAIDAYRRNVDTRAAVRDVLDPNFHTEIAELGSADVVLGGFPCQGFSKAGPKRTDDARNRLYLEMRAVIAALRPAVFLAENVDGLSQNFGGAFLKAIASDFGELGYNVQYRVVDAVAYGVAQHRRRILFVGTRFDDGEFRWPRPTHKAPERNGEFKITDPTGDLWGTPAYNTDLNRPRTIGDAIGDLPALGTFPDHHVTNAWPQKYESIFRAIGEGQKLCNVRHAKASVYTWDIPEFFGTVTAPQRAILEVISKHRRHKIYGDIPNGNPVPASEIARLLGLELIPWDDLYRLDGLGYLKRVDDAFDLKGAMFCSGIFKRPKWDEPSPTVLTNFHNPRYFLHPKESRPFTLRECARLQGFPDEFVFCSADSKVDLVSGYRLVGNAVPPPLSLAFATAIIEFLNSKGATRREA